MPVANKAIAQDADAHFNSLKILGRGGFGEVDHVISQLSLEKYAVFTAEEKGERAVSDSGNGSDFLAKRSLMGKWRM